MDINMPNDMIPSFDLSKITESLPRIPETLIQSPIMNQTPKSVLILGNGFDLDLGLKTSYEDFVRSSYWPFKRVSELDENSLPRYLNSHLRQIDTWYDLEECLARFASIPTGGKKEWEIDKDKSFFARLIQALKEYLQCQEDAFVETMDNESHTKRMSPAHFILDYFSKKEIRSIYTFNYTNLRRIARKLILNFEDKCTHVHGSLTKDNIILGTGDQRNLNDEYFDFYKSASQHYESNNLVEDLNSADEVYIFGHSLGLNDHDYFYDFFKMASKTAHRPFSTERIKVRIFTFDSESEIAIKKQLMRLTDNHLIGLYAHCDFKILKTSNEFQTTWMNTRFPL